MMSLQVETLMSLMSTSTSRAIWTLNTWRDIIYGILDSKGGKATLAELYQAVEGHKRTRSGVNKHWKDKVRQTLHEGKCFAQNQQGEWVLAAAAA